MIFYKKIIKPLLFSFVPETAHKIIFAILKLPGLSLILKILYQPQKFNSLYSNSDFSVINRIGLAAGLDKDAEVIKALDAIGFGFIEIGTVTPKPQPGNPKPRLFRLPKDFALINRMGFNNQGVEAMKKRLKKLSGINAAIGINIGKNKVTPIENAYLDYVYAFENLFDYGDYFVINVSSPNTPNLRVLQGKDFLEKILSELQKINNSKTSPKPLFLKIAPDLTFEQIDEIIELVQKYKLTGIVATNTTISRENLSYTTNEISEFGSGGLSGKPLQKKSTEIIRYIRDRVGESLVIIGVGGIFTPQDVQDKLNAGADIVQIYTSFIYEGPGIVKRLKKAVNESYK